MTSLIHIAVCRKPIEGTIAENCLRHECGGLNIDGCRVEIFEEFVPLFSAKTTVRWGNNGTPKNCGVKRTGEGIHKGRYPANIAVESNEEVLRLFPHTASGTGAVKRASSKSRNGNVGTAYGQESRPDGTPMICHGDEGSSSRFFFNFEEQ